MSRRTRTSTPSTPQGHVPRYRARIFDTTEHDPYHAPERYPEPTLCEDCKAVFRHGRWSWEAPPPGSHVALCPACARTQDQLPAGFVTLDGPYTVAHRAQLLEIARNQADLERREHPLNRIMRIDVQPEHVEIATTDVHLPRRIGTALKRAHDGKLTVRFAENEYSVRVHWRR